MKHFFIIVSAVLLLASNAAAYGVQAAQDEELETKEAVFDSALSPLQTGAKPAAGGSVVAVSKTAPVPPPNAISPKTNTVTKATQTVRSNPSADIPAAPAPSGSLDAFDFSKANATSDALDKDAAKMADMEGSPSADDIKKSDMKVNLPDPNKKK